MTTIHEIRKAAEIEAAGHYCESDMERLREMLLEGARSGPGKPIDETWFVKLCEKAVP